MIRKHLLVLALICGLMAPAATCYANSAETLPEGIFALGFKFGYKKATKRFGTSWGTDTVSITNDYNITVTGADLAPDIYTKDDIIGNLEATYDNFGMEVTFTTAYGITDNLSIMMIIPVQYVSSKYTLNVTGSDFYMVRDAAGNPAALLPTSLDPDATPINAQDFVDALTCRADTQLCMFRYRPLRDVSRWGIGEIITGLRYKVMETDHWRQSITVFNKWPTGRQEETDDLFDTNFGDQQIDIGFWWGIDYTPIDPLLFNLSFGYTEQLPEVKEKRIWSRNYDTKTGQELGTIPLTQHWQKMKVHRDIGGNWDVYGSAAWNIMPYLSVSTEFYFFWKYLDNYWAAEAAPRDPYGNEWVPDFRAMEYGTNQSVLEMTTAVGFSSLPFVMDGSFPVPLMASVGYTVGLAGQNFEQNHSIWLSLDLVGSIYMFEEATQAQEEKAKDFRMPDRADNDGDGDSDERARTRERYQKAESFQRAWGSTNKYGW